MNKARNVITEKFTALFLAVITIALVSVSAGASESGDSSTDAVKKPEKCYELVTGENEEYYSKIAINSRSVVISGCYKNDPVTDITLQSCGTVSSTLKVNPDGTFTSVLNPSEPIGSSDRIVITLKSGAMLSYLIMYDDNRYFPDNKLGKQNLSVLENAVPTSAKSWAGYVTDELTEEGVKQTLDEVAYLADYIAGDIKDDYKKLEAIAKWVSDNIYYDRDARENSVTQSEICIKNVLKSRKTVCVGYSALFSALCEAQGLYVVNVKGTVTSDTVDYSDLADGPVNHEWCAALIDDRWIWVDCVWNSNLKFENNEFISLGANTEMYFDISPLACPSTIAHILPKSVIISVPANISANRTQPPPTAEMKAPPRQIPPYQRKSPQLQPSLRPIPLPKIIRPLQAMFIRTKKATAPTAISHG